MKLIYDVEFNGKKWTNEHFIKVKRSYYMPGLEPPFTEEEINNAIFECKKEIDKLKKFKPCYSNFRLYDQTNIVNAEPKLLWSLP